MPSYITGGLNLDEAATRYLQGNNPHGQLSLDLDTEETKAELAVLKPLLPAPGQAMTQLTLSEPLPGVEGVLVHGKLDAHLLDYEDDVSIVYDVKRVWAREAVMTEEQLAEDAQQRIYAWLVRAKFGYPDLRYGSRWAYAVRGKRPVGLPVDVTPDFAVIDAWFDDVVKPAARAMLALREERAANDIAHNPDSCNMGARCFVARSCSLFTGPLGKGEDMALKFKKTAVNPPEVIETIGEEAGALLEAAAPKDEAPAAAPDTAALAVLPASSVAPSTPDPLEIAARVPTVLDATTERLVRELQDRGYRIQLSA